MMRRLIVISVICAACSGTDSGRGPTATDGGSSEAGVADAGAVDAAPDAGGFEECAGACAVTDALASFGSAEERFDAAYFGFDADGRLRIELYGDAAPGCPTMDSPTPGRTLVVHGLMPPSDRTPQSEGLSVTLFDFDGTLTPEPLLRADAATVTPEAFRLSPPEESFVAFTLVASFEGGTIDGHAHATHCDSLDGP